MGYHAKRKARPEVIRQFNTCIKKLEDARDEYERTRLGNSLVAFNISQVRHTLTNLERDLYLS